MWMDYGLLWEVHGQDGTRTGEGGDITVHDEVEVICESDGGETGLVWEE